MAGKTVLVVEDNPLNMKLVKNILQLGNYRVLEAANAESGLDHIRKQVPDLVLMDIQLPGMDGFTATRIIKEELGLKELPVIALTAYAMQGDEQKVIAAGCDGYISKPLDTRTFLETIGRYTGILSDENQTGSGNVTTHRNRILIVDDVPANVKLLAAKLPSDIYEIVKAYSGQEAIEKVNTVFPDLILLDIMMPVMDGYEVIRQLKHNPLTRNIPIILVTALDSIEDKSRGLETGADEFLTKPVNTPELLARVKSLLRLRQFQEQLTSRKESEKYFAGPVQEKDRLERISWSQRVLLVEDNDWDIRLIQSYLQDEPYTLMVARTGEEAMAIAAREKVDLILLDIILPGMDGFEVCHRLKGAAETRHIQIVVITCLNDFESKLKGVEEGTDDFLVKPINRREIRARVSVLLRKKAFLDNLLLHYEMALNSSINDGLTGLYNHAYFKRFLELEIKKSLRQGYPVTLIMLDVDNFKVYNDTLGHLAGDGILCEFGRLIRKNIREIDLGVRYGGDEFAVVMPFLDKNGSLAVAERIRNAIGEHTFEYESMCAEAKLSISVGIACCPDDANTETDLIYKADVMLYQAKKEGKNRVLVFNNDSGCAQQITVVN